MSTKTPDEQLDQIRHRIDELETKVQARGASAKESIKHEVDALRRQEASARAALREKQHSKSEARQQSYSELERRLGAAESELASEIARGPADARRRDQG